MSEQKLITIANFNCTFDVNKKSYPMLEFFKTVILPAITDKSLTRKTRNRGNNTTTEYFLADISLQETYDKQLVLIGNLFKRVLLDIRQDYNPVQGKIPKGQNIPSAPFSTFMLFLKNHRLVYFPDQQGSPNIRSFETTLKKIILDFIHKRQRYYNKLLKESHYIYKDFKYKNMGEFKDKVFKNLYPLPVLNILPIPSKDLVKIKFKELHKVSYATFKIFNTNSEIDYSPIFNNMRHFMNSTGSSTITSKLTSPKDKDELESAANQSEGKTDYKIEGTTRANERVTISPDDVSEKIPINIPNELNSKEILDIIYDKIKERPEIKTQNLKNNDIYDKNKPKIIDFFQYKHSK